MIRLESGAGRTYDFLFNVQAFLLLSASLSIFQHACFFTAQCCTSRDTCREISVEIMREFT